ncbi:diacylglycerol kinase [Halobacteriales archaeon QS_4_69_34]|nr:MAG: diacylglycerol kinase [Halobacteriales archaeon QS_4_69_34]
MNERGDRRRRSVLTDGGQRSPPASATGDVTDGSESRVLILNPVSGSATHAERVHELAAEHGFAVRETAEGGDAVAFAREVAGDADLVGACGGDGTLNEVVRGLFAERALDTTTVCVIPAGTGNNFAGNIGVTGLEQAFAVAAHGETREIDLGVAAGRPFVNSCIAGLTADASSETTAEMKDSLGVLAYVVNTIRTTVEFEPMALTIEAAGGGESWRGEAAFVLIGNGRRFPVEGRTQANMEDGLFEVTIIEDRPTGKLVGEAALRRLFGSDTSNITRLRAPALTLAVEDDEPRTFSLDGEMLSARELDVETRRGALSLPVGEGYEPDPTGGSE